MRSPRRPPGPGSGRARRAVGVLVAGVVLASPPTGAAADTDSPWSWPVEGPRAIERGYVAPATPYGRGHRGIDILAGPTLLAPADGVVRFAGVVVDRPVLAIDHGDGVVSSYEPVAATVSAGERVVRGQPLGAVLDGHCDVRCVHVGVRIDGQYVSPLRFLGGVPPAVLLPTRPVGGER